VLLLRGLFWGAVPLSGRGQDRLRSLAEEAYQSLNILGGRCQEELLPHELQSAQARAAQPDLILEFREQGFECFDAVLAINLVTGRRGAI
jgi:hypothetical protein